MMHALNSVREFIGETLRQSLRGFELAIAGITLINAHAVLVARADGSRIVPFFQSFIANFPGSPVSVAAILAGFSIYLMLLWSLSMDGDGERRHLLLRAFSYGTLSVFYVALTIAILTGNDPVSVANRYSYNAMLAICCAAIQLRLHADLTKRERRAKDDHAS